LRRSDRRHPASERQSASPALAALLLVAACGFVVVEPWHGPTVLALSEQHGVDAADLPALPLIVLALVIALGTQAHARRARRRRATVTRAAAVVMLGALLLAGILFPRIGSPLVPAAGGTFGRSIHQVDGRHPEPVGRWTHLAVTYDRAALRLYVDGVETSSRAASGAIAKTTDPLWIGGNRPYGEYFHGVIDEVRLYGRALSPSEVRAAMSAPIAGRGAHGSSGLVAAYAFDAGHGRSVTDASGNGNTGSIRGATWTSAGRFGPGIRFNGIGEMVRVPASPSLNLRTAMTITAWIKPADSQSGWRTVVGRQTDAYGLQAGGGRENASLLERLDRLRFLLVMVLVAGLGLALARGQTPWAVARGRWFWPVALFVAGSLLDVAFWPTDTLFGPALLATWCGATTSQRAARVGMCVLAAAFAAVTVGSIGDQSSLPLPSDAGGVVRSAALGLLLATTALLGLRARPAGRGAFVRHELGDRAN
jgi:hypothetical protein